MNPAITKRIPWILLFGRILLFILIQSLFAFGLFLINDPTPWKSSGAFWMISVSIANLVCLATMTGLYRAQGKSYWDLFRISKENIKKDLLVLLPTLLITGPIAMLPNTLLANAIFGGPEATLAYLLQPVHMWIAIAGIILFPITQGATELGLYFMVAMPGISKPVDQNKPAVWAYLVCAFMLGIQHAAAPLHSDASYLLWRGLMFIPFALFIGFILRWRPRLLPYVAVVHMLMDLLFAVMVLPYAYL